MPRQASRQVEGFAGRLREAQDAKGIKTEALARELNVGLRVVQLWRAGKSQPNGQNLIALAAALDRDPGWFYAEGLAA